jgi:hypothetical protein
MTPKSVSRDRLIAWLAALDAYGYLVSPPITASGLAGLGGGVLLFRAVKRPSRDDGADACTLTVIEVWLDGDDPEFDRRLEAGGCHLTSASWHLQVGTDGAARNAERIDVVPVPDSAHPRIHRHPLGWANDVRIPVEFPPPQSWMHTAEALVELHLRDAADDDVED